MAHGGSREGGDGLAKDGSDVEMLTVHLKQNVWRRQGQEKAGSADSVVLPQ